jgi:peroxiredoxin
MSKLKEFQKLVVANAQDVKGLVVGEKAPDFSLPNATGELISLSQCLKLGPVILKFYRGEWCPICNLDLRQIQKYINHFKSFGTQVLAVSPQNPDNALTTKQKNNLDFEVLSDSHQEVIKAYNLQFDPGADYHSRRDLTQVNGDGSKMLPVPATFIINQDFTIVAAHVEANYTNRMSAQDILGVLRIL